MKIQWTLFEMSPLKEEHLKANVEYWKYDTLFESVRFLERMDKSLMVKLMSKSSQASLLFDMARTQNEIKKEQMDEIIQFDVKSADRDGDYVVVFELFISPVFFEMQNNIANPSVEVKRRLNGFKKIFRTSGGGKYQPTSRQGFIDTFEGEMKKYYTKKFAGEVVESDGDELSVMTL